MSASTCCLKEGGREWINDEGSRLASAVPCGVEDCASLACSALC